MFQFRRFPSYTYEFSIGYMIMNHVDCSIRKSADQSVLTTPRSLSQLTTSFIGSWCQGIHPALFLTLPIFKWVLSVLLKTVVFPTRKLSLTFFFVALLVVSFLHFSYSVFKLLCSLSRTGMNQWIPFHFIDSYLFSKRWWAQVDSNHRPHAYQACALTTWAMRPFLVEMRRIELLTPCLQSRCSPSWATPPTGILLFFQDAHCIFKTKQCKSISDLTGLLWP